MEFITKLLGNVMVIDAVVIAVGGLLTWAFAKWKAKLDKDSKLAKTIDALEIAVNETWEELAKKYKKASEDHTLTDEEKAECREYAITRAQTILKDSGIDLLAVYSKPMIEWVIGKIVRKRKANNT